MRMYIREKERKREKEREREKEKETEEERETCESECVLAMGVKGIVLLESHALLCVCVCVRVKERINVRSEKYLVKNVITKSGSPK